MPLRRIIPWKPVLVAAAAVAVLGTALGAAACGSGGAAAAAEAAGGSAAATVTAAAPEPVTSPSPPAASELAGWSNRRLAAQLVFCSVPATNPLAGKKYARMGVGGIVILGAGARSGIGGDLAAVLRAAPNGIRPFIASDEEGGLVQRLRRRDLPASVGARAGHLEHLEDEGGRRGHSAGAAQAERRGRLRRRSPISTSPAGSSAGQSREPSPLRDPDAVGSRVVAWVKGLRAARVLATVKHWPGHGWASGHAHRRRPRPLALGAPPLRHGAVREGVRRPACRW